MKRTMLVGVCLFFWVLGGLPAQSGISVVPSPNGAPLDGESTVVLFFSDSCPHCHNLMRWVDRIETDFPGVGFVEYEVDEQDIRANKDYFVAVMEALNSSTRGWPRTVIGDRVFIGFVPRDGELVYNEEYAGWIGYQNQLYQAIAGLDGAQ